MKARASLPCPASGAFSAAAPCVGEGEPGSPFVRMSILNHAMEDLRAGTGGGVHDAMMSVVLQIRLFGSREGSCNPSHSLHSSNGIMHSRSRSVSAGTKWTLVVGGAVASPAANDSCDRLG